MKVCEVCGEEIFTKDGENSCETCEGQVKRAAARARQNVARKERDAVLKSLGLKKVKGSMGGTYWE